MEQIQTIETSQPEEAKKRWRWGKYRWWVLLFIILGALGAKYYPTVRPEILIAAEPLMEKPLFTIPGIGPVWLTNSMFTLILIVLLIVFMAWRINCSLKRDSLAPRGFAGSIAAIVEILYGMTESTAGKWTNLVFPWFASYVFFLLVVNLIKIIPGFEVIGWLHPSEEGHLIKPLFGQIYALISGTPAHGEGYVLVPFLRGPSTDLNFTLALALISVIATQVVGVIANGPRYFTKFINVMNLFKKPVFGVMDLIVGILELISEFAKIISFTFRLFGVMFSGVVLLAIIGILLPVFFPSVIFLFEIFMGLIQAYVFGMLTMVFMVQATQIHGTE